ncbi:MAG: hypothetical protein OEO83_09335, partial [Alphaproteobacteria bacterium]|nr:hypothetical protein [Alphaproteobacteria bacterium]
MSIPADRGRAIGPLLVLVAATLASAAWQGFDFPADNNSFHVPILLDYAGSAEGPHDLFHRSLNRWVSVFWPLLAPFASEQNLYPMFLGLHLVARFFTAFFIWRLGEALGGRSRPSVAFAAVILFLDSFVGRSPLGHNEILVGYLTTSQVVIPVVLGAWLLAFRGRFGWAGAVLGLAFNINAFNAIWGALALGAVMIAACRRESLAAAAKTIAGAAGLYLLAAAPTAAWIVFALADVPAHEPFSHAQFLRDYYGYHYFIDMMWKEAAFFALTVLAGAVVLARAARHWRLSGRDTAMALYASYAAVVAFGAAIHYVVDHRLMFALNPMRMDSYVVILLGVVVLSWCIAAFRSADRGERAAAVIALMALANGNLALLVGAAAVNQPLPRGGAGRTALAALWAGLALAHWGFGAPPVIDGQSGAIAIFWFLLQAGVILFALLKAEGG